LLDGHAEHRHDQERDDKADEEGNAVLENADECQRREQHHRALREIEDTRGLVDHDKADRDQRIHDPGQQAADQDFQEKRIVEVAHAASSTILSS
jgi:hypothetical protein